MIFFRVVEIHFFSYFFSLQKELDVQEEKKDRADKIVSKIARELKKSSKKDLSEGEKDIKVRELRDFNNSLMKKFGVICRDYADMAPIIHLYFQQAGLPDPPSPGPGSSRASSIGSSRASSITSARWTIFVWYCFRIFFVLNWDRQYI